MSVNLRDKLRQFIALNNYVSAYRTNIGVPAEYTQVEYVFCNPTSSTADADMPYFTTSWKPDLTKDVSIEGRVEYGTLTTRPLILGNYKSGNSSCISVEFLNNKFRLYSMSSGAGEGHYFQTQTNLTNNSIVDFNVQITGNTGASTISATSNGTTSTNTGTIDAAGEVCNLSMRLFKDHRTATLPADYKAPIKVYSLKATENDVVVLDLVPVIRKSDNSIGFYDLATNTFLANEGSSDSNSVLEAGPIPQNYELELTDAIHDGLEDLILYGSAKASPTEYLDTVNANGNSLIQGRDLPLEYTQIDGAVKKGTAGVQGKFDTGIKPTADDVKIEMKVKIGDEAQASGQTTVGSFYACQARATATSEITGISGSQSTGSINGMQNGQSVSSNIIRVKDHIDIISYEYKNGTHSIYVKDLTTNTEDTQTGTYTFAEPTKNLYIFGNTTTANNLNNNNVVYYCRIWESGELIFDGVSVIRNSDNAIGIYDYVTKTFITPMVSGDGSFESGGDAKPVPDNPMDIYDNNGILTPYLDAEGSSSQARIPTPTAPIDMINYKQGLVELRKVGTVKDTLTHGSANATITRNVGVKVFDGTEDFSLVSGYTDIFRTPNNAVYPSDFASNPDSNVGLCNNYKIVSTSTSLASALQNNEIGWNTNGALTVRDSRFTTAAQFKTWLGQMYAVGTPVVLYYPLATATTETVLPAYGAQITRDYEQLEYIGATGTQYIETDISGAMRWIGSGQGTSQSSGSKVILSAKATKDGAIQGAVIWIGSRLGNSDAGKHWTLGGTPSTGLSTSTVPTLNYAEYDVSFDDGVLTGKVNDFTFSAVNIEWDIGVWRIGTSFTNGTGNPNYYFVGNIYEQKAYQNGVLVGDFIPARRKSDGVIGMYDAVSGTFYTNAGTGDFTAGPSMYRNLVSVNDIVNKAYGGITLSIDKVSGEITTTGYKTASAAYTQFTYDLSKPLTAGTYTLSLYNSETMPDSLVGFAINGEVSIRHCSFATTINNTNTFTIAAGSVATQLVIRIQGFQNDPTHQFKFKIQLEKGDTATSYINSTLYHKYIPSTNPETLKDANNYIASCTDLFKLDNVKDVQEVKSGFVNRNCRVLVLDGTEGGINSWRKHGSYAGFFFLLEDGNVFPFDFPTSPSCMVYCTDYKATLMVTTSGQGIFTGAGTPSKRLVIIDSINFDSEKTASDFKKWLGQRYYEDNPVIIVYQAGTSTKYDIDPNDCTIGKYIADGGVETSNAANYFCDTYFPVLPNTSYTMKVKSPVWSFNIAEYDSDKTFIQRTLDPTPHGNKTEFGITTSATTRFIRVGNNTSPDGGVSNSTTLEKIQELSPVVINDNPPYVNEKPQLMKKAPVEITQTALADATINTTNRTVSEPSPDYPIDIACNNGIIGVVDKSDWTTVIGGSGAGTAMYINPDTGKWSYVSSSSDQGSGFIIPIKVGKTYTLVSKNPSGSNNTILRYGQYSDGIMPTSSQGGDNGKQLIKWNAYSSGNVNKSITFRAEQPYLIIQISYSNMSATNGGINTISLIESNASSTDYEELEYVEGTTTGSSGSYIDTLIKPNSNSKVEVKFSVNEIGTNQCVIGSRNASSGTSRNSFSIWGCVVGGVSNRLRFDYQSGNITSGSDVTINTTYTLVKDRENNIINGTKIASNDKATFICNYDLLLFAINSGTSGSQSCLSGKIYYCKIWDNDVLVRDFIPVKRISDNAIGMYDRVSKTFFANSGSGDFVGGPSKGILQNTETTYVNSKNLYDVNNTLYGKYITDTGAIEDSSGTGVKVSCVSNPIPVEIGKTYTFSGITTTTTPATTNYVKVCCYTSDGTPVLINNNLLVNTAKATGQPFSISFAIPNNNTIAYVRTSEWISDTFVQVEEGPRPTQYEVYGRDIVKPLNLLSAGSYMDAQNVTTGITTHNTGVIVFDGSEAWTFTSGSNCPAKLVIKDIQAVSHDVVAPVVCSHFIPGVWNNMSIALRKTPYIVVSALTTNPYIAFTVEWNPVITDVNTWKSWLKDQYNKGTPVILVYPLATAYTEINDPQDILLTSSNSKIERDSEYINNLGIGVNYKKLK